jgi:HK97 family phage portal protein
MGILSRAFERRVSVSDLKNPQYWLLEAWGGSSTATGKTVSVAGSLAFVPVYACVRLLASSIASLPLPVYRRLPGGGKERDPGHPLYTLLHDQPNPEMTSCELRQALVGHLLLWGNAYASIESDSAGRVVGLWPLRPDQMRVERSTTSGQVIYRYTLPEGEERILLADEVMHWRGLSTDGLMGYSPITLAREAVGMGLAAEEYGARFFGNDSRPGGVLKSPKPLTPAAAGNLKESWESAHMGLSNRHRVAVLEEGVEWQSIGIPPKDAQFLELRQFQRSEIAMLFGVPPHMIGDTEKSTSWGTGIEQQGIGFVTYTLRPWLVSIEQRIRADLFTESDRETWFAEFLVDGLLRGDAKGRAESLAIQRQNGVLNADEWREIENRNPLPDGQGKIFLVNSAMISPAQAGGNGGNDGGQAGA